MRTVYALSLFAFALVGAACSGTDPYEGSMFQLCDTHLRPLVESGAPTGGVYAYTGGEGGGETGHALVYAEQLVALDDVLPHHKHTLFETGSVGKLFTAALLAEAVERGEVTFDTPVPEAWGVRAFVEEQGEHPVLLWHLASHTSGLPRVPAGLDASSPNPYAGFTREDLHGALGGATPTIRPGSAYAYSNLGYGLLGQILADAAGTDYRTLLRERVLERFMDHATSVVDDRFAHSVAPAHAFGVPTVLWGDDDALAPAGCVVADALDLLRFLGLTMRAMRERPGSALAVVTEQRFDTGDGSGVGLGWHIEPDGTRWHNGSTGGHHAFVALHAASGRALVVLANDVSGATTDAAFRLWDAMMGRESAPISVEPAVVWERERIDALVGRYEHAGVALTLTREEDRLMARLDGQEAYRLFPTGERTRSYRVVEARVRVTDDGALELEQEGVRTRVERVE